MPCIKACMYVRLYLAIPTSTVMPMLPWQNFSIRVRYFLVQGKGQCWDFVNLISIQWGRIPWVDGRLIILQTDFYSCYFSTLQVGDLHSPGYLKSWEVNGCGGSRFGPLIHGWYLKRLHWRRCEVYISSMVMGITQMCIRASVTKWHTGDVWRELYNPVKHAYFALCKIVLKC
jgi:hypothetical protein